MAHGTAAHLATVTVIAGKKAGPLETMSKAQNTAVEAADMRVWTPVKWTLMNAKARGAVEVLATDIGVTATVTRRSNSKKLPNIDRRKAAVGAKKAVETTGRREDGVVAKVRMTRGETVVVRKATDQSRLQLQRRDRELVEAEEPPMIPQGAIMTVLARNVEARARLEISRAWKV